MFVLALPGSPPVFGRLPGVTVGLALAVAAAGRNGSARKGKVVPNALSFASRPTAITALRWWLSCRAVAIL
jgi:hypothetical protein